VLTLGEIRNGVERVRGSAKKARHEAFLSTVRSRFAGRVLPFGEEIAERWGRLTGSLSRTGITLQAVDAMVAATALHHDLVLVTRNERHFVLPGLSILNPFADGD
jgi:predicted nucleic acid-binding protein